MHYRGVGLDIGTSKISVWINNSDRNDQFQFGQPFVYPCCIYYNNEVLYGEEAKEKGQFNAEFYFENLKSLIDRSFSDPYVQDLKRYLSYTIAAGKNDEVVVCVCENNNIVYKDPMKLLSMIVNHVIECVRNQMKNETIEYLALAYPPSFNDSQKEKLRIIGEQTGLHCCLYCEPCVTCRYYHITPTSPEETILVIDCGAGRCDATIVKYDNGFEIVDYASNDRIGGDRYTQVLMDHIPKQSPNIENPIQRLLLKDAVEESKRNLNFKWYLIEHRSVKFVHKIKIDEYDEPVTISHKELLQLFDGLNKEIANMIKELLDCTPCKPNRKIICGKGMFLESLADEICKVLGCEDIQVSDNEPVAGGLALCIEEEIESYHHDEVDRLGNFPGLPYPPSPNDDSNTSELSTTLTNSDLNRNARVYMSSGDSKVSSNNCYNSILGPNPYHQTNGSQTSSSANSQFSGYSISSGPYGNIMFSDSSSTPSGYSNSSTNRDAMNEMTLGGEIALQTDVYSFDQYFKPTGFSDSSFSSNGYSNSGTNHNTIKEMPPGGRITMQPVNNSSNQYPQPSVDYDTCSLDSSRCVDAPVRAKQSYLCFDFSRKVRARNQNKNNRDVLIKKNTLLPKRIKKCIEFSKDKLVLKFYEGNSSLEENNEMIRSIVLTRDEDHPITEEFYIILCLDIDENGRVTISTKWEDNSMSVPISKDEVRREGCVDIHNRDE